MPYVERDESGKVKGVYTWPNQKAREEISAEAAEVKGFLNRPKPIAVNLTDAETRKLIDFYETNKIITADRAAKMRGY
tara:strand:+ start:14211 stop:14444 length:234 start_codon:yes stop_codon:yes gene_type:complete